MGTAQGQTDLPLSDLQAAGRQLSVHWVMTPWFLTPAPSLSWTSEGDSQMPQDSPHHNLDYPSSVCNTEFTISTTSSLPWDLYPLPFPISANSITITAVAPSLLIVHMSFLSVILCAQLPSPMNSSFYTFFLTGATPSFPWSLLWPISFMDDSSSLF